MSVSHKQFELDERNVKEKIGVLKGQIPSPADSKRGQGAQSAAEKLTLADTLVNTLDSLSRELDELDNNKREEKNELAQLQANQKLLSEKHSKLKKMQAAITEAFQNKNWRDMRTLNIENVSAALVAWDQSLIQEIVRVTEEIGKLLPQKKVAPVPKTQPLVRNESVSSNNEPRFSLFGAAIGFFVPVAIGILCVINPAAGVSAAITNFGGISSLQALFLSPLAGLLTATVGAFIDNMIRLSCCFSGSQSAGVKKVDDKSPSRSGSYVTNPGLAIMAASLSHDSILEPGQQGEVKKDSGRQSPPKVGRDRGRTVVLAPEERQGPSRRSGRCFS